jgi:Ca-activated chloride channel homolog
LNWNYADAEYLLEGNIVRKLSLSIAILLLTSLIITAGSASPRLLNSNLVGQSPSQTKPAQPPAPQQTQPQQNPQPPPPQSTQQPPAAQDQDEPIHLSSRLVLVPVSASNAAGQPVKDLKVEDIVIEEEGKPQQVVALGEPGKTPVNIALLFDVSGSTNSQFTFEQQAATQFVRDVLKPGDSVSLFSIGIEPKMIKGLTANSEDAISGIKTLGPSKEPTAFFDTVVDATNYLNKTADASSRRVLVVISDGEENYSAHHNLNDALQQLQKADGLFYAINPTGGGIRLNTMSQKGQAYMDRMATETGGKAFNLTKIEDLESVFKQIAEELQAQYLFGYYVADERTSAGFKRITVRAPNRPDLRIRARQGYYLTATP